jgi:hypothetical protein
MIGGACLDDRARPVSSTRLRICRDTAQAPSEHTWYPLVIIPLRSTYSGVQKEAGNFYAQKYEGLTRFLLGGVYQPIALCSRTLNERLSRPARWQEHIRTSSPF